MNSGKMLLPLLISAAPIMVGCSYSDASNPSLSIARAEVIGERASLELHVINPTSQDLKLSAIDWSLTYGPLPVAQGVWEIDETVAGKSSHQFSREITFSSPTLDPDAVDIELSGTLSIATDGMAPGQTAFIASQQVAR